MKNPKTPKPQNPIAQAYLIVIQLLLKMLSKKGIMSG